MWETDLCTFLEALDKQEASDERDRLAVKSGSVKQQPIKPKKVVKKATPKTMCSSGDSAEEYQMASKKVQKQKDKTLPPSSFMQEAMKIPASELSLRERLALKAGGQNPSKVMNIPTPSTAATSPPV